LAERVLIVSIDGLRPDLLAVADAPTIRGLAAAGSYTFWAQTVADPYVYTLPAHVSLLTGVNPDRHGVTWNEYIEESYPQVPTLFELAKARGLTTALVSGKMKFVALAKPGTLDHTYLPPDEPVPDALVAGEAVRVLREHRPHVLFVHLPGVDTAGHQAGWGSPAQRAAVAAADAAVGEVLAALRSSGLAAGTVVLLTADHGGAGLTHDPADPRSRTVPWIAAGPGVRRDADLTRHPSLTVRAEDTFATACGVLGIPLPPHAEGSFVEPILEGRELLRPATNP
jgi:predicted AlkP superfamily pyrophosphatase or phosphodiesterase